MYQLGWMSIGSLFLGEGLALSCILARRQFSATVLVARVANLGLNLAFSLFTHIPRVFCSDDENLLNSELSLKKIKSISVHQEFYTHCWLCLYVYVPVPCIEAFKSPMKWHCRSLFSFACRKVILHRCHKLPTHHWPSHDDDLLT